MSLEQTSRELGDARVALRRLTEERESLASRLAAVAQSDKLTPDERAEQLRTLTLKHSQSVADISIRAEQVYELEEQMAALRGG